MPEPTAHSFDLTPSQPFRLDLTAWALRRRAHNGFDSWDRPTRTYRRLLPVEERIVPLSITETGTFERPRLKIEPAELPDRPGETTEAETIRSAVSRLLGLEVDLEGFYRMAAEDPLLGPPAERLEGMRPPRYPSVFESLVNAITCQQISLDVGMHLLNRLAREFSPKPEDPSETLAIFPEPGNLADADPQRMRELGFSHAKIRAIREASQMIVVGDLDLEELDGLDDREAIERLTSLRGVGRWTAEYVLLRGLGRLNVFPGDDAGAHNGLRKLFRVETELNHESATGLVSRWDPWAGLIYFHILLDSIGAASERPA